jgi:hypothetical protein
LNSICPAEGPLSGCFINNNQDLMHQVELTIKSSPAEIGAEAELCASERLMRAQVPSIMVMMSAVQDNLQ